MYWKVYHHPKSQTSTLVFREWVHKHVTRTSSLLLNRFKIGWKRDAIRKHISLRTDSLSVMAKCVEAGIYCAVWHKPGHQLPRSLHLHSMEHPLSVNTLMGGKPNNTEGRGTGIYTNYAEINRYRANVLQIGASWVDADNGCCFFAHFRWSASEQLDFSPCVTFQRHGFGVKRLY